jgi:GDPmannose 4,6-dehydratase
MKKALITGISGQDGSYLAELLLQNGYQVSGWVRPQGSDELDNLDKIKSQIHLVEIDQTRCESVRAELERYRPQEIYHLAAQTFVGKDQNLEQETIKFNILSTRNILSQSGQLGLDCKILSATSLHIFGNPSTEKINIETPRNPLSIYGISKATCFDLTRYYREVEGLKCASAILSNHESPRRPERFVTQKICKAAHRIAVQGSDEILELGNLDMKRDWGWAPEFVEGMWKSLQIDRPGDYFFATGKHHTVREFVELAFRTLGVEVSWRGDPGTIDEYGVNEQNDQTIIKINPTFFRPAEQHPYQLDLEATKRDIDWSAQVGLSQIVNRMMLALGTPV